MEPMVTQQLQVSYNYIYIYDRFISKDHVRAFQKQAIFLLILAHYQEYDPDDPDQLLNLYEVNTNIM